MAFCSRFVASGLTALLIFGCSDWAESTRQDNKKVVQETNVARLLTQASVKPNQDLFVEETSCKSILC